MQHHDDSSSDTEKVIIEFYQYLIAVFVIILISIGIIMLIKYRKCSIDKMSLFAMTFFIIDFIIKSLYKLTIEVGTHSGNDDNSKFY